MTVWYLTPGLRPLTVWWSTSGRLAHRRQVVRTGVSWCLRPLTVWWPTAGRLAHRRQVVRTRVSWCRCPLTVRYLTSGRLAHRRQVVSQWSYSISYVLYNTKSRLHRYLEAWRIEGGYGSKKNILGYVPKVVFHQLCFIGPLRDKSEGLWREIIIIPWDFWI